MRETKKQGVEGKQSQKEAGNGRGKERRRPVQGRPAEMLALRATRGNDGASVKDTGADGAGGLQGPAARMRMRNPRHKGRPSDEVAQGLPLI